MWVDFHTTFLLMKYIPNLPVCLQVFQLFPRICGYCGCCPGAICTSLIISPPPFHGGIFSKISDLPHKKPTPVGPYILWPHGTEKSEKSAVSFLVRLQNSESRHWKPPKSQHQDQPHPWMLWKIHLANGRKETSVCGPNNQASIFKCGTDWQASKRTWRTNSQCLDALISQVFSRLTA